MREWNSISQARSKGYERRDDRVERFRKEYAGFRRHYFPHYCGLPPSRMHIEMAGELMRILDSPEVERFGVAAPRGNAKTTDLLVFILYCICYQRKKFIIYITSTAELANIFLGDIKAELENNERLQGDFPLACGRGRVWRENVIVTRNGIKIQPLGAGKKIRGRKHGPSRPDGIFVDDIEDDEHVRNLKQRDKLFSWFTKAVLKARGVSQKCDFVIAGTLLHFDSLLARVLDPRKSPGWRSRIYKAVIKWADNQTLWDKWQELYTDWHKADDLRISDAHAFFKANEVDMLKGTEVLWPEGEPYYDLMRQRIDEGPISFASEKQNEPLDPSRCKFPEEWFQFFDEVELEGQRWLIPEKGDRIRVADCDIFGGCDPSKGRKDKNGDPSAIITIAAYPSRRLSGFTGRYQSFWVIDGDIAWRHPHVIEDRIFELHALRRYDRFGIETVQFQQLFAEGVHARGLRDPQAKSLRIVTLTPISDKGLRIEKLGQYIYSGRLRFKKQLVALYDHFRYWGPDAPHDDGPDGVELTMETLGEIGSVMVGELDGTRVQVQDGDRANVSTMIPTQARERLDRALRCGNCVHFAKPEAGAPDGQCGIYKFAVGSDAHGCDDHELVK